MIWPALSKRSQPSHSRACFCQDGEARAATVKGRPPSASAPTVLSGGKALACMNGSSRLNLQRKSTHLSLRLVFDWSALGVFSRGSNGGIVSGMALVLPRVLIWVVGSLRLRRSEKRAFTVSDPKKPGTRQQAAEVISPLNRHRVLPGNLASPNIQRAHWSEIATTKPANSEGWRSPLTRRAGGCMTCSIEPAALIQTARPAAPPDIRGDQSFPCIVSLRLSIARS